MLITLPICFATTEKILFADLFDGRLKRFDIQEYIEEGKTSYNFRCLADRDNRVWVKALSDGSVDKYHTSLGIVYVGIFGAISEVLGVQIFSEFCHEFWGFSSKKEFEECWERRAEMIRDYDLSRFQSDVSYRDHSNIDDLTFLDC